MKARLGLAVVVCLAMFTAGTRGQQPAPRASYLPGELLVHFSPALSDLARDGIINGLGARRVRRFAALDQDHVTLPPGLSVENAIRAFRGRAGVLTAQPNYLRQLVADAPPNDPLWVDNTLWGLQRIQAQQAWTTFGTGNGSVVVADIDTGVDYTHPDLAANMWQNPGEIPGNNIDDDQNGYVDDVFGIDTVNDDGDPADDQGHGTHTAGTVAAVGNNGAGVVGVSWNAKVLACKFIGANGYGTDAGAIECFNYIVGMKQRGANIRVSTNSWGGSRGTDPPATALQDAIDAAGTANILNVFAAGNSGGNIDSAPFDPASFESPSIVSVAASDETDSRAGFSNYGAVSVDLAAPGTSIASTVPGGYGYKSGTSMATPHVAGAAVLLAMIDPSASTDTLKSALLSRVDPLPQWTGLVASGGRLNVFLAASALGGGAPPSVALTTPANGTSFTAPASMTVSADASDADGILSVAFYANGSSIGSDSTSPYSVSWTNVGAGSYTLTAVATDTKGTSSTSAPVGVSVADPPTPPPSNAPPTVTLTSPTAGTAFNAPATITLAANASDSDGTISAVAFYANGALIGVDTSASYGLQWSNVMGGSYNLTAVATDNLGATTTSASVRIAVRGKKK